MTKDTPIILMAIQGIAMAILEWFNILTYPTALIVVLLGTVYLVWVLAKIEEN